MGLVEDGFERGAGPIGTEALASIEALFDHLPTDRPGARIDPLIVHRLRAIEPVQTVIRDVLGTGARAVRALLFDKRDDGNWALGWHQDRTIEVADRVEVEGFGPFTIKQGRLHVAPPIWLVERMMTVRIHIDAVDSDNAPLIVSPGSHRLGFVREDLLDDVVRQRGEAVCLANPGDVWFYSTPILHRSDRSLPGRRRRVLQLDWCADALPGGLRWAIDETVPTSAPPPLEGDRALA